MLQLAPGFIGPCRLLHPIMPFVTEELWQKLPKHPGHDSRESIMICSYPAPQSAWSNAEVEADMAYVNAIVARTRRLRSGVSMSPRSLQPWAVKSQALLGLAACGRGCVRAIKILNWLFGTSIRSCTFLRGSSCDLQTMTCNQSSGPGLTSCARMLRDLRACQSLQG